MSNDKKKLNIKTGTIKRKSGTNTYSVSIKGIRLHPIYKKAISLETVVLAHSEAELEEGQKVNLIKTRPMSKRKNHLILTEKKVAKK